MRQQPYDVLDLGTDSEASVDYPDYGRALAEAVATGRAAKGIGICGSGIGMSMALNRNPSVRAALCLNVEMAGLARRHNDANVLVLGARLTEPHEALHMAEVFLTTDFEGGRHACRVEKLGRGIDGDA